MLSCECVLYMYALSLIGIALNRQSDPLARGDRLPPGSTRRVLPSRSDRLHFDTSPRRFIRRRRGAGRGRGAQHGHGARAGAPAVGGGGPPPEARGGGGADASGERQQLREPRNATGGVPRWALS
eukprot:731389-Pyramimonas_sp.AAC.1